MKTNPRTKLITATLTLCIFAMTAILADPIPGPRGPKDDKGDKGDRGAQGLRGPAGPAGANGPAARSVTDAIARAGATPRYVNEVIVQTSDNTLWRGSATTQGAWERLTLPPLTLFHRVEQAIASSGPITFTGPFKAGDTIIVVNNTSSTVACNVDNLDQRDVPAHSVEALTFDGDHLWFLIGHFADSLL